MVTKLSVSAKNKKSNKWWSYFYATKFDNGGISIRFNQKQLDKLLEDIKEGNLDYDQSGYISMILFEYKPIDKDTKQHYQAKGNGYQPQSDVHNLESDEIPF